MNNDTPDDATIEYVLSILRSALNRTYDDGGKHWSRRETYVFIASKIPPNTVVALEDSRIQTALQKWAEDGHIEIIGEDDRYIKIVNPFYD